MKHGKIKQDSHKHLNGAQLERWRKNLYIVPFKVFATELFNIGIYAVRTYQETPSHLKKIKTNTGKASLAKSFAANTSSYNSRNN